MKKDGQFATAWVDKKRDAQILVYLWEVEGLYFVTHMTMTPDFRFLYQMRFEDNEETTGEFRAWDYFETVRSNIDNRRQQIEESLRNAIEKDSVVSGYVEER